MKLCKIFLCLTMISVFCCIQGRNVTSHDIHSRSLLYPSLTDLQLTLCTVSSIFARKFGRLAANSGFQLNFRLPWQLVDFYRPAYWARAVTDIFKGRILPVSSELEEHGRYHYDSNGLSAGQLYGAIEKFLQTINVHPECLAKSVCELAHTPFDSKDAGLLQEVIHFLLTPSVHFSFHNSENNMRKRFEQAEKHGRRKMSCNRMFPKCPRSLISLISSIKYG